MQCTCGNNLAPNATICPQCGKQLMDVAQSQFSQVNVNTEKSKKVRSWQDHGFFWAGMIFLICEAFYLIVRETGLFMEPDFTRVFYPVVNLLYSTVPLLFAIFVKRTGFKVILFIIAAALLANSIYSNFIYNPMYY